MIKSKNIILRPFKEKDASDLARLANDRKVASYIHIPYPYTLRHAKAFIKTAKEIMKKKTAFTYAIIENSSNELVGGVELNNININDKYAEIGYWIGKPFRGKEYGAEACEALMNHGFKTLGLNRIELPCPTENLEAKRLAVKMNLNYEGLLRKRSYIGKKFQDVHMFCMLKGDFRKKK